MILLGACAVCALAAPAYADIQASSAIESVTVYPDGATVTRVLQLALPAGENVVVARDFPPSLDPSSLRVEGAGGAKLLIGAIDARPPRAERPANHPEIEKRIETLKDERSALDDAIAAANARRKFAERFAESAPTALGEKGEARPLAEWRAAFAAIAEEVAGADATVRDARLRQRGIDRDLARLEAERAADPPRKMEVRIDLAAPEANDATLRVTYAVRGARWAPIYDARLDTGTRERKAALELVRRAEIVQQTGEDWSDVALAVSTVRIAKGGSAPDLPTLFVRYPEPRPLAGAPASIQAKSRQLAAGYADRLDQREGVAELAAQEQEASLDAGGFQAVFRVPGRVSVATNEGAKSFRLATAALSPDLIVRAAPALDDTAYLEASFKHADEAPLLPGRMAIYRDGIYVGRGQMSLTPKDEVVRLGFGADDKVKITRATVRKIEASTGLISTAKTDEREFKITIRNGHDSPIGVRIEDQLPVSETADVQVELLALTTQPSERNVKDRRGVLAWILDAAPGEVREIKLGWRVRWPADKSVVYEPRRS
jgi:uncharacterized protein (TIGR02231 family)